jgi:hypothetical protein
MASDRDTPPRGTKLVLMSDELMDALARTEERDGRRVTWVWGEPDEHGWYTPTFTEHRDDAAIPSSDAGAAE